jgi:cyclic pyranopterin phosphate synthase
MVDVGRKQVTERRAVFQSAVLLSPDTFALLERQALPKGDVLTTAKIAGIQAAKQTAQLIPLCHPLFLSYLDVRFTMDRPGSRVVIQAEARTASMTGVEMEALVAVQAAAMTIYDMCKAVQKDIVITDCKLLFKSGGKSGTFIDPDYEPDAGGTNREEKNDRP